MTQLKLNAEMSIIESELHQFHHDNGGSMLLPHITKKEALSEFVKYELTDEASLTSLTIRSAPDGGCILAFYVNDSERYGWLLGIEGRSVLGDTTILGVNTSKRCEKFCTQFAKYLDESGYLTIVEDSSGGGRPIHEENKWAQQEYALDRPVNEIYLGWLERRKKAGRPETINPLDSFKKVIYKK